MKQEFINTTINTKNLPRFEEVQLTPLHPDYRKIIFTNLCITFFCVGSAASAAVYFIEELQPHIIPFALVYSLGLLITFILYHISFKNRGFAFRTHDVIYRSGAIGITTTIIPYNRVQHAALHEGWLARYLGLATVEIFTAGGANSEMKIPGIQKEQAENIKQLLMGKIQDEVSHEE
jgi:membrane protein YdbS with pleckstrin-like domain